MNAPDRDDDLVPISVRLGQVVPPEDPEDWTQPLTWAAAAGMLVAPIVALIWFIVAPPTSSSQLMPGTIIVALSLAAGASVSGATQQGAVRALTGTLAAALFAALVTVAVGALTAGERQVGAASPTLAHAFGAALAGLGGAAAAAPLAARFSSVRSRLPRVLGPGAVAAGVALLLAAFLFGARPG